MIHWSTVATLCFVSAFIGFMGFAVLNMARDERRNRKRINKLKKGAENG